MEEIKCNWYALKVFYNKVFEIESRLEEMGLETYIPVRKVQLKGEDHLRAARRLATPDDTRRDNQYVQAGPVIFKREPVVSSLLFVRAEENDLPRVVSTVFGRGFVYKMADGTATPSSPTSRWPCSRWCAPPARKALSSLPTTILPAISRETRCVCWKAR
jgi:hypothetical protein